MSNYNWIKGADKRYEILKFRWLRLTRAFKLLKALISRIGLILQCKLKILLNKISHFKKLSEKVPKVNY